MCINIRRLGGILKGSMTVCVKSKRLPMFSTFTFAEGNLTELSCPQGCLCNGPFYNICLLQGKITNTLIAQPQEMDLMK